MGSCQSDLCAGLQNLLDWFDPSTTLDMKKIRFFVIKVLVKKRIISKYRYYYEQVWGEWCNWLTHNPCKIKFRVQVPLTPLWGIRISVSSSDFHSEKRSSTLLCPTLKKSYSKFLFFRIVVPGMRVRIPLPQLFNYSLGDRLMVRTRI